MGPLKLLWLTENTFVVIDRFLFWWKVSSYSRVFNCVDAVVLIPQVRDETTEIGTPSLQIRNNQKRKQNVKLKEKKLSVSCCPLLSNLTLETSAADKPNNTNTKRQCIIPYMEYWWCFNCSERNVRAVWLVGIFFVVPTFASVKVSSMIQISLGCT